MKYFKQIIMIFALIIFVFLLLDVFLFRGFFILHRSFFRCNVKYEYKVNELPNKKYSFEFKNKSLSPFYIWTYRNNDLYQEFSDSTFFNYATRFKITLPLELMSSENTMDEIKSYYYGVDCGTGLGGTVIKPFEKFETTLNYDELLEICSWNIRIWNGKDGVPTDLIYNEEIYSNIDKNILKNNLRVSTTDSLEFEFYVPVFCVLTEKRFYATCSSKIKISYLDLLKRYSNWIREFRSARENSQSSH